MRLVRCELDKQLGAQIFERDNKKVLVTPVGAEGLTRARGIILQVEELQRLASSQREPLSFPMTIGVIPTICPYLLPRVMPILHERFPQARLQIVEDQSKALVDMVSRQRDGITSDKLDHCDLMLLKEGHCLKEHILQACTLPEQAVNTALGATSLNTLIQMVLGRLGTTVIPQMALDQLISQHDELAALHLNEPGPHRRIAFVLRPTYSRISTIEALIQVCEEALSADGDDSKERSSSSS